ncbi:hypothetical protein [Petrocella sp. FN5]|uniref:hypothetical protein n=1 Tax=Petrocella sp. FN5 TaxID=3032002 RepID=UPI0023DC33B8|nr:hypothetical protein [Petrocella sp. FN5]MDF1617686.1 hypothetical protein [Petrocella sp. FN5]
MKKNISILLCMVIMIASVNTELHAAKDQNSSFMLYENYEKYSDDMSEIQKYVTIKNGQYKLNLSKEVRKLFNKESISYAKQHVQALNNIIIQNEINNLSLEQGFTIAITDEKIIKAYDDAGFDTKAMINDQSIMSENLTIERLTTYSRSSRTPLTTGGVTKITFMWDGIEIWLSSTATRLVVVGGAGALSGLFAYALVPSVVTAAIAGSVGSIASELLSGVSFPPLVYKYRFASIYDQYTWQTAGGGKGPFMTYVRH